MNNMSLGEALKNNAAKYPEMVVFTMHDENGGSESITLSSLYSEALRIAKALSQNCHKGDRAILIYPPGLELIKALYGCFLAGVIAVPVYPPVNKVLVEKLKLISKDCSASAILSSTETLNKFIKLKWFKKIHKLAGFKQIGEKFFKKTVELSSWDFDKMKQIASDEQDFFEAVNLPDINERDIAFLQYTSGSTGEPKGVMVTHRNLLSNLSVINKAYKVDIKTITVLWLPPYHDMGLIGGVLSAVNTPYSAHLMSPMHFIKNPFDWLKLISDCKATIAGGPNFAYDFCTKRITAPELLQLDLSSWRTAFCGAEPIKEKTIMDFFIKFRRCGINEKSFFAAYGLAEATLMVSGSKVQAGLKSLKLDKSSYEQHKIVKAVEGTVSQVSCGFPVIDIKIVDPEARSEMNECEIGEIWISSDSVAEGYWNKEALSQEVFHAKIVGENCEYLRTGDLGFMDSGELYIAGRIKDLIILQGRNYYSHDLEQTIQNATATIFPKGCVVFCCEQDNIDTLIAVCEIASELSETLYLQVADQVQKAIIKNHLIELAEIIFVTKKSVPKTTSGKIRRPLSRAMYLNSEFQIYRKVSKSEICSGSPTDIGNHIDFPSISESELTSKIEYYIVNSIKEALDQPEAVSKNTKLAQFGLSSILLFSLKFKIEEYISLGYEIDAGLFYSDITIGNLASAIAKDALNRNCSQTTTPIEGDWEQLTGAEILFWKAISAEDKVSASENVLAVFKVGNSVDRPLLIKSVSLMPLKHEMLNAYFTVEQHKILRKFEFNTSLNMEECVFESDQNLDDYISEIKHTSFEFSKSPLAKIVFAEVLEKQNYFIVLMPHLIADGSSASLLVEDIFETYSILKNDPAYVPVKNSSYIKYISSIRNYERELKFISESKYLKNTFENYIIAKPSYDIDSPLDEAGPARTFVRDLDQELISDIKQNCSIHNVAISSYFLGIWLLTLSKATSIVNPITSVVMSNRHKKNTQTICQITTGIPFGLNVVAGSSVLTMIQSTQQGLSELLSQTITNSYVESFCSINKIDISGINLYNFHDHLDFKLPDGVTLENKYFKHDQVGERISFMQDIWITPENAWIDTTYRKDLYFKDSIASITDEYIRLLEMYSNDFKKQL